MKLVKQVATALFLGAVVAIPRTAGADESSSLRPMEAVSIAVDAYIYGYPLVTFDTVRKQQTNVASHLAGNSRLWRSSPCPIANVDTGNQRRLSHSAHQAGGPITATAPIKAKAST